MLILKVRRIKMHASYDTANTDHDIALIEMNRPVKFTKAIRPVCLAEEEATFVGEHSYNFQVFPAGHIQDIQVQV